MWQILQCCRGCLEYRLITTRPWSTDEDSHPFAGPCLVQALAGQVLNGKKGSLCDIHESCDTNIKGSLMDRYSCVETFGSGSVFATRTSRFNKTQGAIAPLWNTSTCSTFSFTFHSRHYCRKLSIAWLRWHGICLLIEKTGALKPRLAKRCTRHCFASGLMKSDIFQ